MIGFDRRLPAVALHATELTDADAAADDEDNEDNEVTLQLMTEQPLLLLVRARD